MGARTYRESGRTVERAANADQADYWRTVDRWGPIVELHVHIEGSMRPDTIGELADANGVELPGALSAGRWRLFGSLTGLRTASSALVHERHLTLSSTLEVR